MTYWMTVCHLDEMEVVQQKFRDDGTAVGDHRILDLTGIDERKQDGINLTFYRTTGRDGCPNVYVFVKEDGSQVRVGPNATVGELQDLL